MSMNGAVSPGSTKEALRMLTSAMSYLSAADATQMAAETQAQCLQALERVNAMGTAARSSILAAFTSGQGYSADADYSPRAWLINRTRVTKGAAVAYTAWVRRAAAHPLIAQALVAGEISESFARTICTWTDKLPEDCREDADEILLLAAKSGADLRDLAGLVGEIYARSVPGTPDDGPDDGFEDRSLRLETTFDGAGVLSGDLTPECAAVVGTVLDALSAPAGAEDTRTHAQRCHDALQEAMRRLVAADLLPERAGQPAKVWAHISLADLMVLDGSSALLEEWTARVRAQWAGHRAEASAGGSDGGAWLDGDAAEAVAGAGRCNQPAAACQVHHVKHKANGGKTSVRDCVLLCSLVPPPGCDPPVGLDAGPEPGRDHDRVEPGQDEGPAQPQPASPRRVTPPARSGDTQHTSTIGPAGSTAIPTEALSAKAQPVPDDHPGQEPRRRCHPVLRAAKGRF